jgi:1-acyl-sn-glycerol-3-phosphate acyltransferase
MLRALYVSLAAFTMIFVLGIPLLLYAALSRNTDVLYGVGVYCAGLVLRIAGVRLEVRGREKVPVGRAVVFMANHQSNADPPALAATLPPVLFLAKKEAFRIPILGRAMRLRGFVSVDRKNRERAARAIDEAAGALRNGKSFLVYPEGTRSPDGRLQPLRKGVFVMALKAGAPIVPVSVSGATHIMRKGEWAVHSGLIRITLQDPVQTENRSLDDRDQVMEEVRRAILQGLEKEEWGMEDFSRHQASTSDAEKKRLRVIN